MQDSLKLVYDNFIEQAGHCEKIGSPFYAQLLTELAGIITCNTAIKHKLSCWQGLPSDDAVGLRFAAALHYLVLNNQCNTLANIFPSVNKPAGDIQTQLLVDIIDKHESVILKYLESPPQTNEVGRSMALLGGFLEIAKRFGADMDTFEIGASAGLNMLFDKYYYQADDWHWGDKNSLVQFELDWRGSSPPLTSIKVNNRHACDLSPVDITGDKNRLLAYVWPDQFKRFTRIDNAIEIARNANLKIDKMSAADWLLSKRHQTAKNRPSVFYNSIMWQYMPSAEQQRALNTLNAIGAESTATAPVIWLRMEPSKNKKHAEVRMTTWPRKSEILLANCGYHGEWVECLLDGQ